VEEGYLANDAATRIRPQLEALVETIVLMAATLACIPTAYVFFAERFRMKVTWVRRAS